MRLFIFLIFVALGKTLQSGDIEFSEIGPGQYRNSLKALVELRLKEFFSDTFDSVTTATSLLTRALLVMPNSGPEALSIKNEDCKK